MGYFDKDQPRVGVFVDVQNMFYAAKDRYASRLDYIKLLDLTVGPRHLVVAYAYIVQIPEIDQSSFLSLLEHNGYRIKTKDLRLRGDGSAKGDWDVGIAIDVIDTICDSERQIDTLVLLSGDGDFDLLLRRVTRDQKIKTIVYGAASLSAKSLKDAASEFRPIEGNLLMKKPNRD